MPRIMIQGRIYKCYTHICVYECVLNREQNISISDDAYLRLSELKLKNESFTELIYRLTNKINALDLKGMISEDEGKSLEKNIGDLRIGCLMF